MAITTIDEISWGSYGGYEGPYWPGRIRYTLPFDPTLDDKLLEVIAATEGTIDGVNMYDRCIISVGLIQFCEARYFLVTKMLGSIAEQCGIESVTGPLREALEMSNAEFKRNNQRLYRFFQNGVEVMTHVQQQKLFLGGSSGKKGDWTVKQRMIAKAWAAGMANIWQQQCCVDAQKKYIAKRLNGFIMPEARKLLFTDENEIPWTGMPGALRAAYISFAANLPAVANKHAQLGAKNANAPKWSNVWCISVIKQMTFGPGIAIYKDRYDRIRPVLERQYHIELPKNWRDLQQWSPSVLPPPIVEEEIPVSVDLDEFTDSDEAPTFQMNEPDITPTDPAAAPFPPSVFAPEDSVPPNSVEQPLVLYREENWFSYIIKGITLLIKAIVSAFKSTRE